MGQIVIVTNQCYLIAEQIHFITVKYVKDDEYGRKRNKGDWVIEICFTPVDNTNAPSNAGNGSRGYGNKGSEHMVNVSISATTAEQASKLHSSIVSQIRKFLPDQLFLDEAIDRLLSGEKLADEPIIGSTKKVRRTRKKKRRS